VVTGVNQDALQMTPDHMHCNTHTHTHTRLLRWRGVATIVSASVSIGPISCLFVCEHISKTSFTKFSTHIACGRGSVLVWRYYAVFTVLWMTSC